MSTLPKPAGMTGAEARAILRSVLRHHPDAASVTHGRMINSLTVAELHLCLNTLGVNVANVLAQVPASAVATQPDDARPEDETQPDDAQPDPIETELAAIRGLVVSGGFGALDDRLRSLLIAANKPPVTIEVPAPVAGAPSDIPQAKQTGATVTWGSVFGVTGALASRTVHLWDGAHPDTPKVNSRYQWPQPQTSVALAMLARQRNVLAFGPAGTGKTEFACQLAARLGRPFALVSCDSGTDAATLVGMTVPGKDGGVTWQDGQLTRAIQTPGCVICIDEPSVARPGALFVLQNVLANRVLYIAETGRRVPVAPGCLFVACDNTAGLGGGARRGYTDTNRLNGAFLDRFAARVAFNWLPAADEARVLVSYTGCTLALATLLVGAATTTRAAADAQDLTAGIGLRRLFAWAELLSDGIDPETAFVSAVLNAAPEADHETLRQQCALTIDENTVARALAGHAPTTTTEGSN
jgi:MoxR-like ATPase